MSGICPLKFFMVEHVIQLPIKITKIDNKCACLGGQYKSVPTCKMSKNKLANLLVYLELQSTSYHIKANKPVYIA